MSDDQVLSESPAKVIADATTTVATETQKTIETAAKALPEPIKAAVVNTTRAVKVATVKSVKEAAAAPAKLTKSAKPAAKRNIKTRAKQSAAPLVKASAKVTAPIQKRKYVRKPIAVAKPATAPFFKGTKTMNEMPNMFASFTALPGADKYQAMFTDVSTKGQDAVKKSQAFAEQMTEAAKANVEAMVESTKIATAGARDLGQEVVASTKSGVEHASAAVKSLTEAKSPTEFFQLQSDLMKSSFDRMVSEGSKFTEQMVKLAGESIQPLSNRASVSAEKFSELTA